MKIYKYTEFLNEESVSDTLDWLVKNISPKNPLVLEIKEDFSVDIESKMYYDKKVNTNFKTAIDLVEKIDNIGNVSINLNAFDKNVLALIDKCLKSGGLSLNIVTGGYDIVISGTKTFNDLYLDVKVETPINIVFKDAHIKYLYYKSNENTNEKINFYDSKIECLNLIGYDRIIANNTDILLYTKNVYNREMLNFIKADKYEITVRIRTTEDIQEVNNLDNIKYIKSEDDILLFLMMYSISIGSKIEQPLYKEYFPKYNEDDDDNDNGYESKNYSWDAKFIIEPEHAQAFYNASKSIKDKNVHNEELFEYLKKNYNILSSRIFSTIYNFLSLEQQHQLRKYKLINKYKNVI